MSNLNYKDLEKEIAYSVSETNTASLPLLLTAAGEKYIAWFEYYPSVKDGKETYVIETYHILSEHGGSNAYAALQEIPCKNSVKEIPHGVTEEYIRGLCDLYESGSEGAARLFLRAAVPDNLIALYNYAALEIYKVIFDLSSDVA